MSSTPESGEGLAATGYLDETRHASATEPPDPSHGYQSEAAGRIAAMAFAALLIFPIRDVFSSHPSTVRLVLVLAGVTAFVGLFAWRLVFVTASANGQPTAVTWLSLVVLVGLVAALVIGDDPKRWAPLFIFLAAAIGVRVGLPWAAYGIAACTVLAVVVLSPVAPSENTAAVALQTLAVGALTVGMGRLRAVINELHEARERLARLAVAEERLRFARDLHDLLGHSLSLIALKADYARRLLPDQAEKVAAEVADIDAVAREALSQVRHAVTGYRQPTMVESIEAGRRALEAAGISATYEIAQVALPRDLDAALAWALREAVTNAIRHSHARHCWISVTAGLVEAAVEVVDDGVGGPPPSGGDAASQPTGGSAGQLPCWAGNGLSGLAERMEALHGRLEVSRPPGGGFRLRARVPTTAALSATAK